MLVLGVDIAARKNGHNCGLALIDASKIVALGQPGDDLIWTRTIDGTDLRAVAAAVAEVKAYGEALIGSEQLLRPAGAMLAIERQFTARVSPDPATVDKLIESRVQFTTICKIRGVAFELVYPASWQTILALLGDDAPKKLSKPRKAKAPKPKKGAPPVEAPAPAPAKMIRDTKAAARLLVSRLYPGAVMGPDECDAILLARFAGWRARAGQEMPEWRADLQGAA